MTSSINNLEILLQYVQLLVFSTRNMIQISLMRIFSGVTKNQLTTGDVGSSSNNNITNIIKFLKGRLKHFFKRTVYLDSPSTPHHQTEIHLNSVLTGAGLQGNPHKAHTFLSFLSVTGWRHASVFSVGFLVPFGMGRAWEVKGRMAALALSLQVSRAGARRAPTAEAENNPAAVVGQGRVTGRACHTGESGFSGCHQRAVITSGLIISGHV